MPSITNETYYREPWHLVDEFNSTYWSGLDANVFIGDIFVEEIVQVQYQIVEQVTPYYGYANYTAQRMHRGQRVISGSFLLNFKQSGYLFSLINTLTTDRLDAANVPLSTDPVAPEQNFSPAKNTLINSIDFIKQAFNNPSLIHSTPSVTPAMTERIKRYAQQRATYWNNDPKTNWGPKETEFFGKLPSSRRPLYAGPKEGLTLKIVYGNPSAPSQMLHRNALGQYERTNASEDYFSYGIVSTVELLSGVEITGLSKVVDDSGRPTMEQYSFIARDYMDITPAAND